jgi:UDP-N-acetylglucosamine--dolichyl-phosphate N-acetylglucosaminephosphotransferase
MWIALLSGLTGLVIAAITLRVLRPLLLKSRIVGKDMNKPGQPEILEMGGLAIVAGVGLTLLLVLGMHRAWAAEGRIDSIALSAVLSSLFLVALIGMIDDLIGVPQPIKAITPLLAALPLTAAVLGDTTIFLPLLGQLHLGALYPLIIIPLGVTGAANATNMLAGFNGLEVGLGLLGTTALLIIAGLGGNLTVLVILSALWGALLVLLYFNWYPARIFIGDVGTLSIGALWAASCIVGNFEAAGVIVIIPYGIDFLLKARKRFPSTGWWGEYRAGKLYCPEHGPVGLAQLILKLTGGLHERDLVLVLMGLEALCGLMAVWLYL